MAIRPYSPEDEDAVVALWDDAGLLVNPLNDPRQDIALCLSSGHGTLLLEEEDGEIIGAVMVGHDGHRGWVYYLGTATGKRHAGVGRRLMAACEEWLKQRGLPKLQLMVRNSNTRAIGFYQRCGYLCEPTAVMSRRLDGHVRKAGGQTEDQPVVVTYLEMTEMPRLPAFTPKAKQLAVLRAHEITVGFYRYLYDAVGRDWVWTDRKVVADEDLVLQLRDPAVDVYVLYVDGAPAGYYELDGREDGVIDLAYFGLIGDYIGRGLGPFLLRHAIETAWARGPDRVTVNTCTLDHPKALPMYQRCGFRPYKQVEGPAPWQKIDAVSAP